MVIADRPALLNEQSGAEAYIFNIPACSVRKIRCYYCYDHILSFIDSRDDIGIILVSADEYCAGEEIEDAVLPDGTAIPIETPALIVEDGGEDTAESGAESADSADGETAETEAATEEEPAAEETTTAAKENAASAKDDKEDKSSSALPAVSITAGAVAVIAVAAVIVRKKK